MALLLKGGAVFLHVPKTGGRWVGKVLEESGFAVRLEPGLGGMVRVVASTPAPRGTK